MTANTKDNSQPEGLAPVQGSPCDWRSLLLYALGDHSTVKVRLAELRLYEHEISAKTFSRRIAMLQRDLAARRQIVAVIFHARPKRWWANKELSR